jgi:hypothetical protein
MPLSCLFLLIHQTKADALISKLSPMSGVGRVIDDSKLIGRKLFQGSTEFRHQLCADIALYNSLLPEERDRVESFSFSGRYFARKFTKLAEYLKKFYEQNPEIIQGLNDLVCSALLSDQIPPDFDVISAKVESSLVLELIDRSSLAISNFEKYPKVFNLLNLNKSEYTPLSSEYLMLFSQVLSLRDYKPLFLSVWESAIEKKFKSWFIQNLRQQFVSQSLEKLLQDIATISDDEIFYSNAVIYNSIQQLQQALDNICGDCTGNSFDLVIRRISRISQFRFNFKPITVFPEIRSASQELFCTKPGEQDHPIFINNFFALSRSCLKRKLIEKFPVISMDTRNRFARFVMAALKLVSTFVWAENDIQIGFIPNLVDHGKLLLFLIDNFTLFETCLPRRQILLKFKQMNLRVRLSASEHEKISIHGIFNQSDIPWLSKILSS